MKSTSDSPAGSSNTQPAERTHPLIKGPFMLTLCRLAGPVMIRPPESPLLKPFTFFTSRARQADGSERLYLHMGYFDSLNDAERWAQIVRRRYPHAIATVAPSAAASLTDTQVMNILEMRRSLNAQLGDDEKDSEQVALLRPEDTGTRQALKQAVAQGAPVSFAVQLQWAAQPLDLSLVRALEIFKPYTLYATETHREGRSRYFLRLGFFEDPVLARQVATQALPHFASAAVVPVTEQEVARAREAARDSSAIPNLAQPRSDVPADPSGTPESPPAAGPSNEAPRRASRAGPTLEQTLIRLARKEMLTDSDSVSASGVRHLKIEVQRRSRRL